MTGPVRKRASRYGEIGPIQFIPDAFYTHAYVAEKVFEVDLQTFSKWIEPRPGVPGLRVWQSGTSDKGSGQLKMSRGDALIEWFEATSRIPGREEHENEG